MLKCKARVGQVNTRLGLVKIIPNTRLGSVLSILKNLVGLG